jgi:hypothetical protein
MHTRAFSFVSWQYINMHTILLRAIYKYAYGTPSATRGWLLDRRVVFKFCKCLGHLFRRSKVLPRRPAWQCLPALRGTCLNVVFGQLCLFVCVWLCACLCVCVCVCVCVFCRLRSKAQPGRSPAAMHCEALESQAEEAEAACTGSP